MWGFIKKDLFLMKRNFKILSIILLVFIVMAWQGETDLSFLLPMICIILFISTFSYDEYNQWNAYAITLPNGRKYAVISKYLATLVVMGIATLFTTLISILFSYLQNTLNIQETLEVMSGSLFAIILIVSFLYPFIFHFGVEKGRICLFVGVFAITALIGFLSTQFNLGFLRSIVPFIEKHWFWLFPTMMVGILYISYRVSAHIYKSKEF